ncbi:MAG: S8 family serine peptidase [Actinobacteria bacterium]|nr:S8 family serine peptidase [Actinomycetota bacterium]
MIRKILAAFLLVTLIAVPAWASNDPGLSQQWGMHKIGAPSAWQEAKGEGIVIAIIDTGIYFPHEDLNAQGKFVDGKDYIDDEPPQDQDGHGTHVAGIAAALTGNGRGVGGVAPNAKLMSVRVLNEFGVNVTIQDPQRLFADTADAVRWSVDHGARVINMSLGPVVGSGPDPDYASALAYAWSKGAVPVVAAGNDHGEPSGFSNHPVLVVVATTSSDAKADYSNRSGDAQWGISAPGSSIYSTYCCYLNAPNATDGYENLSGTSMAAPHVSGVAAALLSMGLNNQQAVNRILSTARDLGPAGADSTFGHGLLDMAKAVEGGASSPASSGSGSTASGSRGSTGSGSSRPGGAQPGAAPGEGAVVESPPTDSAPEAQEEDGTEATVASEAGDEQTSGIGNLIVVGILALIVIGYFVWQWWAKRKVSSS